MTETNLGAVKNRIFDVVGPSSTIDKGTDVFYHPGGREGRRERGGTEGERRDGGREEGNRREDTSVLCVLYFSFKRKTLETLPT